MQCIWHTERSSYCRIDNNIRAFTQLFSHFIVSFVDFMFAPDICALFNNSNTQENNFLFQMTCPSIMTNRNQFQEETDNNNYSLGCTQTGWQHNWSSVELSWLCDVVLWISAWLKNPTKNKWRKEKIGLIIGFW